VGRLFENLVRFENSFHAVQLGRDNSHTPASVSLEEFCQASRLVSVRCKNWQGEEVNAMTTNIYDVIIVICKVAGEAIKTFFKHRDEEKPLPKTHKRKQRLKRKPK